MSERRYSVAVLALHPIQYQAGLWRAMARHPRLDVRVLYLDTMGVDGTLDPSMKSALKWDIPLLEGHPYEFLRNRSPFRFAPIIHRVNPSVVRKLSESGYDAIIVHGYLTLTNWLVLLSRRRGGRLVFRGEGTLLAPHSRRRAMVKAASRFVSALYFRFCDAIAHSCEDNRAYLLTRGAAERKLFPMPCAVDNEQLARIAEAAAPPAEVRRRLGIPVDAVLLATAGRFVERKRIGDCVEAMATAPLDRHAEVHLLVAGDGPDRERLEAQALERGVADRVHFPGFMNQQPLIEALLAADVFVMASQEDPSPKAMSEALFLKLPIVCSDRVGTASDLVHPRRNGFIFPCGNVAELARSLGEIVGNPAVRREMGVWSRRIAERNDFTAGVESLVTKLDQLEGVVP